MVRKLAAPAFACMAVVDLLWDALCTLSASAAVRPGSRRFAVWLEVFVLSFGLLFVFNVSVRLGGSMRLWSRSRGKDKAPPSQADSAKAAKRQSRLQEPPIRLAEVAIRPLERELAVKKSWGRRADTVTYNTLICACAKVQDPARAEGWLARMAEDGVEPDVTSYTSVIDAYGKQCMKGSAARAEMWLDRMIAAGVKPSPCSFAAVITATCKNNDVNDSVRLLDKMAELDVRGNLATCTAVLDACARMADARAPQLLRRMRDDGVKPGIANYTAAARALAVLRDYASVEKLQRDMDRDDIPPDRNFLWVLHDMYRISSDPDLEREERVWQLLMDNGWGSGMIKRRQQPKVASPEQVEHRFQDNIRIA